MIITRSGRATEPKRAYVHVFRGSFFSLLSLFLLCFLPCVVCLMCVSWKINTAKLRKINKCQRSTRSLSHLTIITLIWDMLTNLLCPHLSRHWLRQRQPETGDWRLKTEDWRERCSAHRLPTGLACRRKTSNLSALCCRLGRRCHQRRCRCAACCVKLSN